MSFHVFASSVVRHREVCRVHITESELPNLHKAISEGHTNGFPQGFPPQVVVSPSEALENQNENQMKL
jgi:hypothetical protein